MEVTGITARPRLNRSPAAQARRTNFAKLVYGAAFRCVGYAQKHYLLAGILTKMGRHQEASFHLQIASKDGKKFVGASIDITKLPEDVSLLIRNRKFAGAFTVVSQWTDYKAEKADALIGILQEMQACDEDIASDARYNPAPGPLVLYEKAQEGRLWLELLMGKIGLEAKQAAIAETVNKIENPNKLLEEAAAIGQLYLVASMLFLKLQIEQLYLEAKKSGRHDITKEKIARELETGPHLRNITSHLRQAAAATENAIPVRPIDLPAALKARKNQALTFLHPDHGGDDVEKVQDINAAAGAGDLAGLHFILASAAGTNEALGVTPEIVRSIAEQKQKAAEAMRMLTGAQQNVEQKEKLVAQVQATVSQIKELDIRVLDLVPEEFEEWVEELLLRFGIKYKPLKIIENMIIERRHF